MTYLNLRSNISTLFQTAGWFVIISPLIVIFFYAAWFVFNRKFQLGMSWGEFFQDGFKPTERWFRLREEVAGIGKVGKIYLASIYTIFC